MSPATTPRPEDVAAHGESIYDRQLRAQVEKEHHGKYPGARRGPGEYEIDDEDVAASRRLLARRPDAVVYGRRIGHPAAYRLGGFSAVER